jgi:hypothetical protein
MADGGVVQPNVISDKIKKAGNTFNNGVDTVTNTAKTIAETTETAAKKTTDGIEDVTAAAAHAALPVVVAATAGKTLIDKISTGAKSAFNSAKNALGNLTAGAETAAEDVAEGAKKAVENPGQTLKVAGEDLLVGAEDVGTVLVDGAIIGLGRISKKYILNIIILLLILVIFYIIYCIYNLNGRGKSALAHIKNRFVIS